MSTRLAGARSLLCAGRVRTAGFRRSGLNGEVVLPPMTGIAPGRPPRAAPFLIEI